MPTRVLTNRIFSRRRFRGRGYKYRAARPSPPPFGAMAGQALLVVKQHACRESRFRRVGGGRARSADSHRPTCWPIAAEQLLELASRSFVGGIRLHSRLQVMHRGHRGHFVNDPLEGLFRWRGLAQDCQRDRGGRQRRVVDHILSWPIFETTARLDS